MSLFCYNIFIGTKDVTGLQIFAKCFHAMTLCNKIGYISFLGNMFIPPNRVRERDRRYICVGSGRLRYQNVSRLMLSLFCEKNLGGPPNGNHIVAFNLLP